MVYAQGLEIDKTWIIVKGDQVLKWIIAFAMDMG